MPANGCNPSRGLGFGSPERRIFWESSVVGMKVKKIICLVTLRKHGRAGTACIYHLITKEVKLVKLVFVGFRERIIKDGRS